MSIDAAVESAANATELSSWLRCRPLLRSRGPTSRRGRHEHVGPRDDPHHRRRGRHEHDDEARRLGHSVRRADVRHVVGHDDRHDAALGSTDGAAVCGYEP
jgi:hypothetical protein